MRDSSTNLFVVRALARGMEATSQSPHRMRAIEAACPLSKLAGIWQVYLLPLLHGSESSRCPWSAKKIAFFPFSAIFSWHFHFFLVFLILRDFLECSGQHEASNRSKSIVPPLGEL
jgi:hypothetical protein